MNFPYNALGGVHPLITTHPSIIIPYLYFLNVGDPLFNKFLGYLFNGEGENNLASHVEETKALELRFSKNVINK
jgi:hypothetical protein